ncbi:MAG: UDP-2,4-diacetamido-2,4,6-trideoxy-beta-L-altropyranose hydrolase [bacterium]|nr:UDP-2,4-diacetamido-2,4,6-trideoxy-beta-L-altropyranose hydrolase [bacterium]
MMTKKEVIFRVDGGHKIGFGHIVRSLTLAEKFGKKNEILFLMKDDPIGIKKVEEEGYEVCLFKDKYEINDNLSCNIFISDIRDTSVKYMEKARSISECLVTFDDLGKGRHLADVLVDANIDERFSISSGEQRGNLPIYLFGASYILLREEFGSCKKKEINEKVKHLLITMGGSDSKGVTLKITEAIEEMKVGIEVVIIIGKGFMLKDKLIKTIQKYCEKYTILYDEKNIFKYMLWADLAIASAGVTMFELACCGVPTIVIPYDEDQEKNTCQFLERNLIINLGISDYIGREKIARVVNDMIKNYEAREKMSKESQKFVDGRGLSRIVKVIKNYKRG